jgi:hypothetical protein
LILAREEMLLIGVEFVQHLFLELLWLNVKSADYQLVMKNI